MSNDVLDLAPLALVIARLREGMSRHQLNANDTLIRDGLIQRFKVTYEVSCRTLKRYLEATSANPAELDAMPFQDLIRSGNERGLLRGDWPAWRKYRDMRSRTSHTYSEDVALQVLSGIPDFIEETAYLLRWTRLSFNRPRRQ